MQGVRMVGLCTRAPDFLPFTNRLVMASTGRSTLIGWQSGCIRVGPSSMPRGSAKSRRRSLVNFDSNDRSWRSAISYPKPVHDKSKSARVLRGNAWTDGQEAGSVVAIKRAGPSQMGGVEAVAMRLLSLYRRSAVLVSAYSPNSVPRKPTQCLGNQSTSD